MASKHPVSNPGGTGAPGGGAGTDADRGGTTDVDVAIRLDRDLIVDSWSAVARGLTGLRADAVIGRNLEAICQESNLAQRFDAIRTDRTEIILEVDCGARGTVSVETRVSARRDPAGSLVGYDLDVLESPVPEDAGVGFADGAARWHGSLSDLQMQDSPAFLIDGRTLGILEANPAASAAFGKGSGNLTGMNVLEVLDPGRNRFRLEIPDRDDSSLSYLRLPGHSASAPSYGLSLVPVRWGGRDLAICILYELTGWTRAGADLVESNRQLSRLARHDHLTGLFNKPMFLDTLELANSRVDRSVRQMGVLYIDLDGFKPVNDRYGHDTGDALLVEVVRRLKSALRSSDVMARLGGDEFGVILENLRKPEDARKVALHLIERVKEPFSVEGQDIQISASVGAVVTAHAVEDATALVAEADRAMYEAKSLGHGQVALSPARATAKRRQVTPQS